MRLEKFRSQSCFFFFSQVGKPCHVTAVAGKVFFFFLRLQAVMRVDDESFCSFFLLLQQHQVPGTKGGWAVLIYTWSSSCIFPQCGDSVINQDMGWPWTPSYKYARSARPLLLCSFSPAKSVHPLFVQIIPPEIRLQFSWPQIVNILVDEVFVLNFLMFLEGGRVRAFFCFSRFSWFFFFFFLRTC